MAKDTSVGRTFHLMRDGKIIASADSTIELLGIFHRKTSYSYDHGRKHEGWDIVRDPFRSNPCRNPGPATRVPRRTLMTIGKLQRLDVLDPATGKVSKISGKGSWLAWDGRAFHIVQVTGSTKADLPAKIVAKHKKFHQANPAGSPFVAECPTPSGSLTQIGLLKGLVYVVPQKVRSPGKNKYLWHHAFGDTGHKGGDYSEKVMPALKRDARGNLFIVRRPGNIFRVDNWLRG